MKERDVVEALMNVGVKRGSITYDELNEALPAEFFSLDEIVDFLDRLRDLGVSVVECGSKKKFRCAVCAT